MKTDIQIFFASIVAILGPGFKKMVKQLRPRKTSSLYIISLNHCCICLPHHELKNLGNVELKLRSLRLRCNQLSLEVAPTVYTAPCTVSTRCTPNHSPKPNASKALHLLKRTERMSNLSFVLHCTQQHPTIGFRYSSCALKPYGTCKEEMQTLERLARSGTKRQE